MTAPAFTAHHGRVLFEGRPVPEFRAIVASHHMTTRAIDPATPPRAAELFWIVRRQIRDALESARQQRAANPIKRSA